MGQTYRRRLIASEDPFPFYLPKRVRTTWINFAGAHFSALTKQKFDRYSLELSLSVVAQGPTERYHFGVTYVLCYDEYMQSELGNRNLHSMETLSVLIILRFLHVLSTASACVP